MIKIGDTFYLTAPVVIDTNEYKPQTFGGGGSGDESIGNSRLGALISAATRAHILNTFPAKIAKDVKDQENNILIKLQALPQTLDANVSSIVQKKPTHSTADTATQIGNYIDASNILLTQKTQEYNQQKTIADTYYYGRDFFSYPTSRFISLAISNGMVNMSPDVHYKKWFTSLQAAYAAKYVKSEIDYLQKQTAWLNTQIDEFKDSVSFASAVSEQIVTKYGTHLGKIAKDLQSNITGKKIRSYAEAMATFEKVNANPRLKLNAQDRQAVVNALNVLDKATFADNVRRLGKAFGVTGTIVQADTLREKTVLGYQTGDWKPLLLEFEAMAAGKLAGMAAGAILAFLLSLVSAPAAIAVPAVAVLMAAVASYLDAKKVDEINNMFIQ
ncbi:hypothetical protein JH25_27595 [Pseudomonas sp. BRG-100]|uniref:colicin-like pore-forming protein n=1 Tax=Pseudomonas sp. BRG-100 TaxID=1524267 RepID=UPI0004E63857|nr:colicin-like pore-forming protein [Pseudomonas sp. BRG-100]KFF42143.1 hypothetical protein JH25_27595 [Pseudomonas sp. BRG-100]